MKGSTFLSCALTTILLGASSVNAAPRDDSKIAIQTSTALSPSARGELARAFVLKWGGYAQKVYGVDVKTWSERMVGTFASADAANFQAALKRSTYEGAMATLDGSGYKLPDANVVNILAKSDKATVGPYALGDLDKDLVYTAVPPCRLADTRSATAGIIAGGTSRGIRVWGFSSLAVQGGDSAGCGLISESPEAIVVNLTAVLPSATGYATLFPASGTQPLAASMLYTAGGVLSNAVVVKLGTSGSSDFNLFSEKTSHYVVDIVGFYDAPHATALDCQQVNIVAAGIANGVRSFETVSCPTGYTVTGGGVATGTNSGSYLNASGPAAGGTTFNNSWFSSVTNGTGSAQSYTHYASCCRVPGR